MLSRRDKTWWTGDASRGCPPASNYFRMLVLFRLHASLTSPHRRYIALFVGLTIASKSNSTPHVAAVQQRRWRFTHSKKEAAEAASQGSQSLFFSLEPSADTDLVIATQGVRQERFVVQRQTSKRRVLIGHVKHRQERCLWITHTHHRCGM